MRKLFWQMNVTLDGFMEDGMLLGRRTYELFAGYWPSATGPDANRMNQPGSDLALFGSADLAATLMRLGLIDEYRILVTPVVLGGGTYYQPQSA